MTSFQEGCGRHRLVTGNDQRGDVNMTLQQLKCLLVMSEVLISRRRQISCISVSRGLSYAISELEKELGCHFLIGKVITRHDKILRKLLAHVKQIFATLHDGKANCLKCLTLRQERSILVIYTALALICSADAGNFLRRTR